MTRGELHKLLSGRMHKSDILEILRCGGESCAISEALIESIFDDDDKVAQNALWVSTWGKIERMEPIRERLVGLALKTCNSSIRRLTLTLLERMTWGKDDVRTDLLDYCLERMASLAETAGVRALCIKLAYLQCQFYKELLDELAMSLEIMGEMQLAPAVKYARMNIMKKMAKNGEAKR